MTSLSGKSVALRDIQKSWGKTTALDGVTLDIEAGKFTALLGPSGCGKSTALRLISGLEAPTSGGIKIGGEEVTGTAPAARDIAMVFQSYALFPHLSVAENIIFGLRVRGINRSERDVKLTAAADLLGLRALLDRKPSQLSGGQQQRVALGRAIVAEKSIFLMDEPLSNLDAKLRGEMREEIRSLQQRLGVTMIYVTHDQVEAVTMADCVVLMNHGRVEQVAPPRQIYDAPQTLFAARFIGTPPMMTFATNMLGIEIENVTLGLRPECVKITQVGPIRGEVTHVEYLGADAMIECRVQDTILMCRVPGKTDLTPGSAVSLNFAPEDLHAFDSTTGRRLKHLPFEIEAASALQATGFTQADQS